MPASGRPPRGFARNSAPGEPAANQAQRAGRRSVRVLTVIVKNKGEGVEGGTVTTSQGILSAPYGARSVQRFDAPYVGSFLVRNPLAFCQTGVRLATHSVAIFVGFSSLSRRACARQLVSENALPLTCSPRGQTQSQVEGDVAPVAAAQGRSTLRIALRQVGDSPASRRHAP